jgi:hypothetical protein
LRDEKEHFLFKLRTAKLHEYQKNEVTFL